MAILSAVFGDLSGIITLLFTPFFVVMPVLKIAAVYKRKQMGFTALMQYTVDRYGFVLGAYILVMLAILVCALPLGLLAAFFLSSTDELTTIIVLGFVFLLFAVTIGTYLPVAMVFMSLREKNFKLFFSESIAFYKQHIGRIIGYNVLFTLVIIAVVAGVGSALIFAAELGTWSTFIFMLMAILGLSMVFFYFFHTVFNTVLVLDIDQSRFSFDGIADKEDTSSIWLGVTLLGVMALAMVGFAIAANTVLDSFTEKHYDMDRGVTPEPQIDWDESRYYEMEPNDSGGMSDSQVLDSTTEQARDETPPRSGGASKTPPPNDQYLNDNDRRDADIEDAFTDEPVIAPPPPPPLDM
jgi:hypothetical protein